MLRRSFLHSFFVLAAAVAAAGEPPVCSTEKQAMREAAALRRQGDQLQEQGLAEEARETWRRAIEAYRRAGFWPGEADTFSQIAASHSLEMNVKPEAMGGMLDALTRSAAAMAEFVDSLEPPAPGVDAETEALFGQAAGLARKGDCEKALPLFDTVGQRSAAVGAGTWKLRALAGRLGCLKPDKEGFLEFVTTLQDFMAIGREVQGDRKARPAMLDLMAIDQAERGNCPSGANLVQVPAPSSSLPLESSVTEFLDQAAELFESGHWREARDIYQDLLCRSERDGHLRGMALALVGLANVEVSLGNPASAETLLQRALGFLPLVDEERGEAFEAAALEDLGGIFFSTGRLEEGIAAYRDARQLFARAGRADKEAMSLISLGQELSAQGDHAAALAALDEAEALLRRLPWALAQDGMLAVVKAGVEFQQGKFQDAITRLYKAQDFFRLAGASKAEAGVLVLISAYQEFLGREEQAGFVQKTEALVGNGVAPELSQLLDPLRVGDFLQQGKPEEAVELGRELLASVKASEDGSAEASIRFFLALSYFELGRNAEAREELAAIASLPQGPQTSDSLTTQVQALARMLGTVDAFQESAAQLGDVPVDEPGAFALIQKLVKDLGQDSKVLAPEGMQAPPGVSISLHELGILESLAQGDREGVRQKVEETVALVDRWAQGLTLGELKSPFFSRHLDIYAQAVQMNLDRPEEAFRYAEEARARAFLDGIGNQKIEAPRSTDSELLRQERRLRMQLDRLKRDLRSEQRQDPQDQNPERLANLQQSLEQTAKDWEELGLRLKATNPAYASLVSVAPASLGEIQGKVLDGETTLVEYFVPPENVGAVLAWVIDRGHFTLVPLRILTGDLKSRVELFRNLIESGQPVEPLAEELYSDLFAPLAPHVRHENLVIVPHGVLHFLPFAALWDGKSYLGDSFALSYSPSATALKLAREKKAAAVGPILAVGNPDGSLTHAAAEAETVARRYGARPLLGAAASEGAVVARAGQSGILHLAAHAVLNPVNPLFTRIELAPDEGHDGSLEMHEVFGLDLSKTGLVVLSACRTQLGRLTAGDEIEGLTRAFLYAGTPAVMSSLWDVQDDSTSFLMERFYTHLRRGQGRAEALRRAQVETRRRHPHPYHWAAFVLTGDGR